MFDLSKITETISGLLSGNQQQPLQVAGISELLANAGIDPALLEGLNQDQILSLLQQHGIDPSQLDIGQISELLQNADLQGNVVEIAQSWLKSRGG